MAYMPYFETNDRIQLHYTDWGDGEPVVFCHAWALNSDAWQYQIPDLLDAGLRCITYDRRGHGRSDRTATGYDVDTLADDVATLLDVLDIESAHFVGHSVGCREIVRFATRHGAHRVRGAVFLAPLMPDVLAAFTPEQLGANAATLKADVPGWCAMNAAPFFGDRNVSRGLVDWVSRQIIDMPLPVLLRTMAGYAVDFTDELRAFDVPTLVVHGDADASAPLDHTGARVAALVPDAELTVLPGAGHGLYASDHDVVNEWIVKFLCRN